MFDTLLFARSLASAAVVLLWCAGVAASASSMQAVEISIDQLTQRVIEGNRDLHAAILAREAARAASSAARALPNPRFEINAGRSAPRSGLGSAGAAQSFGATQLVETDAIRAARVGAALSDERTAVHYIARLRNELAAQTRRSAFEALLRQEEADAAGGALRLLEEIRERVRVRVDSGEAPRYEIIKADAEIISARQRRDSALLQAQKALLELNRLAGGTLGGGWRLSARLDDPMPRLSLDSITSEMLERSPELAQLGAQLDRAQAQLQSAQASRWPGIELRVDHTRDPEIVQSRFGVSFSAPLLDSRVSVIDQASAELARAKRLLDGRRSELLQEVLLGWKELEIASGAVDALGSGAVREAEAALRVAEAAYKFGERGILEVLDAQRVLRSVRFELLQARFRLQSARIELEQLAGRYCCN